MIVFPNIVAAARRNGLRQLQIGAGPGEKFTQVDAVVDLLVTATSPAAQPPARVLLKKMAERPWTVIRGVHTSPGDPTQHVTIEIGKRRFHLRVDARECVFDITFVVDGTLQRLTGREPWLSPGSMPAEDR